MPTRQPDTFRLDPAQLRPRTDPAALGFATTDDVEPLENIVGQDRAVDALEFGLRTDAPGHHVFVRGLSGTGRLTLVEELLERVIPFCALSRDRVYVRNFAEPDRPRLLTLPAGQAHPFRRAVDDLIDFIRDGLQQSLESEAARARRAALDAEFQTELARLTQPFESELRAQDLGLVNLQTPDGNQRTAIVPIIDDKPVTPDRFEALRSEGKLDEAASARIRERIQAFAERYEAIALQVSAIHDRHRTATLSLYEQELRASMQQRVAAIRRRFEGADVGSFLDELTRDLVHRVARRKPDDADFAHLYRVNVVIARDARPGCPIVVENAPTLRNLLGTVERKWSEHEEPIAEHMAVTAGSLVRADGGYLILDARDVMSEPGAWKVLIRTLRSGLVEIVPSDLASPWTQVGLKPEAIDVQIKVVLIGETSVHLALDAGDPDFPHLFKVLADFDQTFARDDAGANRYAGVLARIARDERLPRFDRGAVAMLVEHGSRIAARNDRLTTRFGRLSDIAREAAFLARDAGRTTTEADDVRTAIRRGKARADMPARRFRELIRDRILRVETTGHEVGQINGLAVVSAGPLTYGFPARITAAIGPGSEGVINVERESKLSGAIHTKGMHILGGLLRRLLPTRHPLTFRASIVFEQSYGGIDGDSASGAEACCLLSALTGYPLRQDLAITGAIDQLGHLQPVGAVPEKIEGFYDVCESIGLTGTQGVIVPRANLVDLMLREDVVAACERGEFHVYAVDRLHDALALLTGMRIGELGPDRSYPTGTLFGEAMARAIDYWNDSGLARRSS